MAMMRVGLFCLAAVFVTSAHARPLGLREKLIITNCGDYVNKILDTHQHAPDFGIRDSGPRYPSTKESLFHVFKHLRARDLLKVSGVQERIEDGKPVPVPRVLVELPGLKLGPAAESGRRGPHRECGAFVELLDKYIASGRWTALIVQIAEETQERLYKELPLEPTKQAQNG